MRNLSVILELARAFSSRNRKHFVLPFLAIVIGLIGLIVVLSVINGFDSLLIESLTSFFPHLLVDSPDYVPSGINELLTYFPLSIHEGVVSMGTNFSGSFVYTTNEDGLRYINRFLQDGRMPLAEREIVLGKEIMEKLALTIGDIILLYSYKGREPVSKQYTVVGTLNTGIYQFDSSVCVIRGDLFDFTAVYLLDPMKASEFKRRIEKDTSFVVYSWQELNQSFYKAVKMDEFFAMLITVFVVLLSGFGVSNSILYSVLTRKKEIAVLSSLGLSSRSISAIFGFQVAYIATFGSAIGVSAGVMISYLISKIQIPLPSDIFYTTSLPVKIEPLHVLIAVIFEFSLAIVFSMIPARMAGKIDPMEVLRYE